MSCRAWEDLASARLDDALTAEQARALEVHQILCRECAERDLEMGRLKRLLAGTGTAEPFAGFV